MSPENQICRPVETDEIPFDSPTLGRSAVSTPDAGGVGVGDSPDAGTVDEQPGTNQDSNPRSSTESSSRERSATFPSLRMRLKQKLKKTETSPESSARPSTESEIETSQRSASVHDSLRDKLKSKLTPLYPPFKEGVNGLRGIFKRAGSGASSQTERSPRSSIDESGQRGIEALQSGLRSVFTSPVGSTPSLPDAGTVGEQPGTNQDSNPRSSTESGSRERSATFPSLRMRLKQKLKKTETSPESSARPSTESEIEISQSSASVHGDKLKPQEIESFVVDEGVNQEALSLSLINPSRPVKTGLRGIFKRAGSGASSQTERSPRSSIDESGQRAIIGSDQEGSTPRSAFGLTGGGESDYPSTASSPRSSTESGQRGIEVLQSGLRSVFTSQDVRPESAIALTPPFKAEAEYPGVRLLKKFKKTLPNIAEEEEYADFFLMDDSPRTDNRINSDNRVGSRTESGQRGIEASRPKSILYKMIDYGSKEQRVQFVKEVEACLIDYWSPGTDKEKDEVYRIEKDTFQTDFRTLVLKGHTKKLDLVLEGLKNASESMSYYKRRSFKANLEHAFGPQFIRIKEEKLAEKRAGKVGRREIEKQRRENKKTSKY